MSTTTSVTDWPTVHDPKTCVRKGQCPVTQLRGQSEPVESHTLYFEQHGNGPEKILFIMGLNTTSFSWATQVRYFAKTGRHSVLVFDNRGVGNSTVPKGPYTTSGMAEDVIVLLDHVGWTEDFHVVGLSLGGMVAQELATRIPKRIVSLSLCVTKAGGLSLHGLTPWKGLSTLIRATLTKDPDVRIRLVLGMMFPDKWLDSQNPDDPDKRTNREIETAILKRRIEVTRPQTLGGAVSQSSAALTHRITADRHRFMATTISKILILTGDQDDLINPANSKELAERMPEAEYIQWAETGHGLHAQWPERFNKLIERVVEEGRQRFEENKLQGVPSSI
ncbi:alpha/beta-hydrolase [Hysterangium stoloniferum]|nr:alpha/beta-hydrolase [Hysterangium stoloniferum]